MTAVPQQELAARLNRATEPCRLLEHPFYRAWADGTLTLEDLGVYSAQYYKQVEAFPGYLDTLAARLPLGSSARSIVEDNLKDERDDDHPELWLRFAEALGARRAEVQSTPAEPETLGCVDSFATAAETSSPAFALGMLYGYESQTPEVAETKIAGLKEHYGISDDDALSYFELHGKLDVHHSGELARALAEVAADEPSLREAEEGAAAGARAIWELLDGVARVRGIA